MTDAVEAFRAASESYDVDAMAALLRPDAELVSPLSGRMIFRGSEDMTVLLRAVYSSLRDLRWGEQVGTGPTRLLIGRARIGPCKLGDAMVFELAPDGRIQRIRPHLRPWLGLTAFALIVGPKVARHPRVVLRALRG